MSSTFFPNLSGSNKAQVYDSDLLVSIFLLPVSFPVLYYLMDIHRVGVFVSLGDVMDGGYQMAATFLFLEGSADGGGPCTRSYTE